MSDAQVRIRHARVSGLSSRDAVGPLLRRLELSRWPALDPRRIVVVRRVALRANSAALEAALSAELEAAVASAVELVPNFLPPASANAVAFTTPALRLACLASDLASGVAHDDAHWWWRAAAPNTGAPAARAVASAWAEEPLWLPSVVVELARVDRLAPVWELLDEAAAECILDALGAEHALPVAVLRAPAAELEAARLAPELSHSAAEAVPEGPRRTPWPAPLGRLWAPALARLSRTDVRVRLAAVLAALEAAPGCTRATGTQPWLAWLAEAPAQPSASAPLAVAGAAGSSSDAAPASSAANPAPAPLAPRVTARGVELPRAPISTSTSAVSAARPSALERSEDAPLATSYAGAVFVLNALAHPELQSVWQPQAWLHGWSWWQALCADLDLPPADPLARQLVRAIAQSAEIAAPSAAARADFHASARGVYAECWSDALIHVPGSLRFGPTHWDVWLPLASVRMPVRRAGLDLTPGWLPWLGRVVTIHYVAGAST